MGVVEVMMTIGTIERAEQEAKRFLEVALLARRRIMQERAHDSDPIRSTMGVISGTRETGACRRVSMDLSRALADMRKTPKHGEFNALS